MHPEEIEDSTKTNSLKVNNELLYIAGMHVMDECFYGCDITRHNIVTAEARFMLKRHSFFR